MHPGASLVCNATDLICRIEGASVHITSLNANDRWARDSRNRVRSHPPLVVHGDTSHALSSQPQQAQCLEQADVHLIAHDHSDWWGTKQALPLDIPTNLLQNKMPCGSQPTEVCHCRAAHETSARIAWQA